MRSKASVSFVSLPLFLLLLVGSASASDGVFEINQACAVQTGCFDGDAPGFPVTLTLPGSYRLTSHLSQTSLPGILTPTDAVLIDADRVQLDLGGFSISCANPLTGDCGSGNADGIVASGDAYEGLRITNGFIQGMSGRGIYLQTAVGAQIDRVQAIGNGGDGIFAGVEGAVSGSSTRNNGGNGIVVFGGAHVSDNTVAGNTFDGIRVATGSMVTANVVQQNGGDGVVANFGSSVFDNVVFDNGGLRSGFGLALSAQVAYRGNALTNNAAGGVSNGVNLGENYCSGPNVSSITCP